MFLKQAQQINREYLCPSQSFAGDDAEQSAFLKEAPRATIIPKALCTTAHHKQHTGTTLFSFLAILSPSHIR